MASSSECPPESVKAEVLREFCASSSIHGIRYFDRIERTSCERFWWIVVFLLSLASCGTLIFHAYRKWDQNSIIISTSEKTTPVWEVPFPAVTICPGVKVSPMLLNITQRLAEFKLLGFNEPTEELTAELKTAAYVCENVGNIYKIIHMKDAEEEYVVDRLKRYSLDRYELFTSSFFNFESNLTPHLKETVTDEGLCYSFNLLPEDIVFRKEALHADYNYMENWYFSYKEERKLSMRRRTLYASGAGRSLGLRLGLETLNSYIEKRCNHFPLGFHLTFHEPSTYPHVSKRYIEIPVGHTVSVALKPQIITTSESAASYHWSKRQCFFNDERHLQFFKIYNQENCELECLANVTVAVCDCAMFWMPRAHGTPVCSLATHNCNYQAEFIMSGRTNFSRRVFEAYKIFDGVEKASKCNCLPSCSSVKYDTEMSILAITRSEDYEYGNSYTTTYLDVYFKESHFLTSQRSELYGTVDFLSNCGGLLGLFMGFSILSLLEICYFFTIRPLSLRKKKTVSETKSKKGNFNQESGNNKSISCYSRLAKKKFTHLISFEAY